MLWCKVCSQIFDEGIEECPFCGGKLSDEVPPELLPEEELSWGRAGDKPEWPLDSSGKKEKAVFLGNVKNTQMNLEVKTSVLNAYGIPVLYAYPESGELVKVIFGFTGAGVDLYVPESCLEDAKNLIKEGE